MGLRPRQEVASWQVRLVRRSCSALRSVSRPQPTFHGSNRQARGRVLAALREGPRSMHQLLSALESDDLTRGVTLVDALVADGLVERRGRLVTLSGDHQR